jgi:hypothetical protein
MMLDTFTSNRKSTSPLWLLLLVIASLFSTARGQASPETWTNVDGREMIATLLQATDTQAEFRLQSGKRARLKLDQLIEEDRDRVRSFRSQAKFWKRLPKDARWPERVTLNWLESKVDVVEDGTHSKHVYRTPHFEFVADAKLAPNLVKDFSKIFEVTHAALEKNPLGLRLKKPKSGYFRVRLFSSMQGYANAGGPPRAAGVYIPRTKEILVPFRSLGLRQANVAWVREGRLYDPSTLLHEVTHQLLDHWLDYSPMWFTEGIAEVIGAARYDSGQLFFDRLEEGIKSTILGKKSDRHRASSYAKSQGPAGFQFPIHPAKLTQATQAQFMGYRPAKSLEQREIVHNYQCATLLVHFAMNDGKAGRKYFRKYLETHRQAIARNKLEAMDFSNTLKGKSKQEAADFVEALYKERHKKQKEAAQKAYPILTRDRSEEVYFEALTRFYKPFGIILTKGS